MTNRLRSFFVFDVESIGLYGEAFAVAGGVYLENGAAQWEFFYACPPEAAKGTDDDRAWIAANLPLFKNTHRDPVGVRAAFWKAWERATKAGALMAGECVWPVEINFLRDGIAEAEDRRNISPYPLHEVASIMLAAGMDPMATYDRTPSELPKHNPLADARQSARLLSESLKKLLALVVLFLALILPAAAELPSAFQPYAHVIRGEVGDFPEYFCYRASTGFFLRGGDETVRRVEWMLSRQSDVALQGLIQSLAVGKVSRDAGPCVTRAMATLTGLRRVHSKLGVFTLATGRQSRLRERHAFVVWTDRRDGQRYALDSAEDRPVMPLAKYLAWRDLVELQEIPAFRP